MAGPFLFFFYRPILYIGFEVRNFLCLGIPLPLIYIRKNKGAKKEEEQDKRRKKERKPVISD